MSKLRPFQAQVKAEIYAHWHAGRRNVIAVIPTGGGKAVVNAEIFREHSGAACVIAHRGELVSQLAKALAEEGVRHRIIGPPSLMRTCTSVQLLELGRSMTDPGARVAVAGVDTLVKRDTSQDSWFRGVALWAVDEAHHVQTGNKWGTATSMFPNARGLGWTATPLRADGGGLGSPELGGSGIFDAMVVGPGGRELIRAGYLTDYRVFCPPSDVVYDAVPIAAGGDYSPAKLRAAVHASDKIVGDVVKHYQRIAPGKLGITFAVDVEAAQEIARAYRAEGVTAEVVSAKTDDVTRVRILRQFREGSILQLVNVDLFGEGFDVPACEVISMVRKTESYGLYCQQFGRGLRPLLPSDSQQTDAQRLAHIAASKKPRAIVIDHVGNVIRHGLPDAPREWSLANRERRSKGAPDAIPLRVCLNLDPQPCMSAYPRYMRTCPYCGFYPEPVARTSPEMVDGDLHELDEETLAALRGEVQRIDGAPQIPVHLPPVAAAGLQKQWAHRQAAQGHLRNAINLWAGWKRHQGYTESESYRQFFHAYGVDTASAAAYKTADAQALHTRISDDLHRNGVIAK